MLNDFARAPIKFKIHMHTHTRPPRDINSGFCLISNNHPQHTNAHILCILYILCAICLAFLRWSRTDHFANIYLIVAYFAAFLVWLCSLLLFCMYTYSDYDRSLLVLRCCRSFWLPEIYLLHFNSFSLGLSCWPFFFISLMLLRVRVSKSIREQ